MTSALANSRSYLRHALASLRSGHGSGAGEGPPITVTPFDSKNVSTGAGLLKLATSIAAARRTKANFATQQQDAELSREYIRAQIAHMRAQGDYYEGRAHAPGAQPHVGNVIDRDMDLNGEHYAAGTPTSVITAKRNAANDKFRHENQGRRATSVAAMNSVYAQIDREAANAAQRDVQGYSPYLAALTDPGAEETMVREARSGKSIPLREHALNILREGVGGDWGAYSTAGLDPNYTMPNDILARQKQGHAELERALLAKHKARLYQQYAPELQRHRDALNAIPSDAGEADGQNDPPDLYRDDEQEADPGGVLTP